MELNIITCPTVEVVAKTTFIGHATYKIPKDGDQAVQTCAFAAKGCYDSYGVEGNPNKANQAAIISSGHGSVLEHFHLSLFIEGVTRALTLELNRHRHFNISQRSTRYTNENEANFVLEPYYALLHDRVKQNIATPSETELYWQFIEGCQEAQSAYVMQVDRLMNLNPNELRGTELRKWARGKARNLLPHALETRGTWTTNIRGWRHFIETRSSRHAETEIRRLVMHVHNELNMWIPFYLTDYETEQIDGFPEFTTVYKKV